MTLYGRWETWPCPGTPQVLPATLQASWPGLLRRVQIKNIKLHIVTDIKVNFNSMLGFRISNLVGGKGTLTKQLKIFSHPRWTSASLPVPRHRVAHHAARCPALQKTKKRPKKDQKAYGTRCSQAVPHPSTILARRCLTSVIRRERVCSSWYGRRRSTTKCNQSHHGITVIEQATSPTWCEPNFLDRSELMSTDKKYQTSYSH